MNAAEQSAVYCLIQAIEAYRTPVAFTLGEQSEMEAWAVMMARRDVLDDAIEAAKALLS